ncbi:energy transducer TonB, partial [Akkermansiaceae bacterium]|nr:energy transducer TonB [Akkermansiaceae bacterium]
EKKKAAEQKARDRAAAEARDRAIAKKRMDEKRNKAREAAAKAKAKARAIANAKAAAAKRAADAKRIVSKPSAISQKKPRYPSIALRAGHQGTTTLRLTIGSNGRVTSASVSKSSGHSSLDQAALSVVRSWRFKPARNGAGQAVSYTMTQSVPFRIR